MARKSSASRKSRARRPRGGSRARSPRWSGGRRKAALWGVGLGALAAMVAMGLWVDRTPAATEVPQPLRVRVVDTHPHRTDAFTQGLLWHDGKLYESTGRRGKSSLREVEPDTGRVLRDVELDASLFAEGLARVGDRFIQLTWHAQKALVWKRDPFELVGEHRYRGEGWGLCYDGKQLVMSDGSEWLTFRDAETFDVRRRVRVTKVGRPLSRLNELECVDGSVWANVWPSDEIVRIDPRSGKVTATVDASGLLDPGQSNRTDVLNGIAWAPERERFFITGKLWPKMFEVEFVPREK